MQLIKILDRLPSLLREKLLHGSVGKVHLSSMARDALAAAAGEKNSEQAALLFEFGLDMLRAAWESDPLDGTAASQFSGVLRSLHSGSVPVPMPVPDGTRKAAELTARLWSASPESSLRRLSPERARSLLEKKLARTPGDIRLLHQAFLTAMESEDPSWGVEILSAPAPGVPEPVRAAALGQLLMCAGEPVRAAGSYAAAMEYIEAPHFVLRRAECFLRSGDREQGLSLWRDGVRRRPWHVNAALRFHDLIQGLDHKVSPLPGKVAALLYTWNKCADLDLALHSLANADSRFDLLVVLDNGSTDETSRVLDAWQSRLPEERFERIDLHVNIGAPAARNWLMSGPALDDVDWCLYLDDDALVPSDWRERFGAAVERYPDAGVWGCKVVDGHAPHLVQSTDLHLRPSGPEDGEYGHVRISDLQLQEADLGLFNYLRPCVSVTGCCHLFRTRMLRASGGFDLSFSPSQFDDLEHDLRMFLKGRDAVYQGHASVRHLKRSGETARTDAIASGNAQGNMHKLAHIHPPEEARTIREREAAVLYKDLAEKIKVIQSEMQD